MWTIINFIFIPLYIYVCVLREWILINPCKLGVYHHVSNAYKIFQKWIQANKICCNILLCIYDWFSLFMDSVFMDLLIRQNLFLTPINTSGAFMVICRHVQNSEKFEPSDVHIPSEVKQGNILPCYFSSCI